MPACYSLCWQTIVLHNPQAVLLGPNDVAAFGGQELFDATAGLPVAIESDLVRAWILSQQGGVWVDLDTICLGPIRLPQTDAPLTCVRNPHGRGWSKRATVASPWACVAHSRAAASVYEHALRLCRQMQTGRHVPWGQSSAGVVSVATRQNKVQWLHPSRWHPIPSGLARSVLLRKGTRSQHFTRFFRVLANCTLIHLSNPIPHHYRDATESQILGDNTYVAHLLNVALGRPPAIAGRTASILDRIPRGCSNVGVEVGVFRGLNAAQLLQQRRDLHLYCVDPYEVASADYRATKDHQTGFSAARWSAVAAEAARRLRFAGERVTWIRQSSPAAAGSVSDGSVDWVWIDGNHSAQQVAADIHAWWPKIRPGGWIGGHDYHHRREGRGYGVTAAVDAWAAATGATVVIGADTTWFADHDT